MAQRPKPLPMAIPGRIKGVPPSQTTLGHATSWDARSFAPPRMDPSPKPVIAPPKAPPFGGGNSFAPAPIADMGRSRFVRSTLR
jgi:hypothetical protein